MQTLHRLRRFRDLRAPPTASPIRRRVRRIRKRVPPSCPGAPPIRQRNAPLERFREAASPHPGQALRGFDRAPQSLTPSLELAPRAGRFREVACASGRSSSACPESGTGCRIGFAALRLSGKLRPIPPMVPRMPGSMATCLAASLHVCVPVCSPGWSAGRIAVCMSACRHAWQTACLCPSPDR